MAWIQVAKGVWKFRKPIARYGKKGAKKTWGATKRGTQWVGMRVAKHWMKRQPHPERPWSYRRVAGVPEGIEFVTRGPKGYYDYKRKQFRYYRKTAKAVYSSKRSKKGGPRLPSTPTKVRRGRPSSASKRTWKSVQEGRQDPSAWRRSSSGSARAARTCPSGHYWNYKLRKCVRSRRKRSRRPA